MKSTSFFIGSLLLLGAGCSSSQAKKKTVAAPVPPSQQAVQAVPLQQFNLQPVVRPSHGGPKTQGPAECVPAPEADLNTVQLALLLDTSGSMNGLINQAKTQLWSIVNELATAERSGKSVKLQIALYEYGNSGLKDDHSIRMILPFTADLDAVSRELFSLTTNGGSEFCGAVIERNLNELKWSELNNSKLMFVCGNEAFSQGPIDFKVVCPTAKGKDIIVNTIFCGPYNSGVDGHWLLGAELGGGVYSNIETDAAYIDIPTPYDDRLRDCNLRFNKTYIPYGNLGSKKQQEQISQDSNASKMSFSSFSNRAKSKSSSLYSNSTWDLVDASKSSKFDIKKVKRESLPKALQPMSDAELKTYIIDQQDKRKQIGKEISDLNASREKFRMEKLKEMQKGEGNLLESKLINSLRKQCATKDITWGK